MKKGMATKQLIIEKAARVLNQKGISGTAISDIMGVTGLAKGGIYRQFKSKEEIVSEAFNFLSQRLALAINNVLKEKSSSTDKLFALLDFYHDRVVLAEGGCPLLNFGSEADDTDAALSKRVGNEILSAQQKISGIVSEGIATGEFKQSVSPNQFGIKMFNVLEGTILICRLLGNKHQMKIMTEMLKTEIEGFKS